MSKIPLRSEIDDKYKWNTKAIYETEDLWEKDFEKIPHFVEEIQALAGKISTNKEDLIKFFQIDEEMSIILDNLYLYSAMKKDEDNGNSKYQGLFQRVQGLAVDISAKTSFVQPELQEIPEETLNLWLEDPRLSIYKRLFYKINRSKPYTLSKNEEEILALTGEMCQSPRNIYGMLNNVDIDFPVIKTPEGEQKLSHGSYISLMENKDREVRKNTFEGLYTTYEKYKNTLSALMAANIKKDIFNSKVRKFSSSLNMALFEEEIPESVYNSLITAVENSLPAFYKYVALRKKALGVDELHMYDIYNQITQNPKEVIPYEDALEMVYEGLQPLGEDYINIMKNGVKNGWVDVYENQGKTPGAYSSGVYKSMPYVLLNYSSNLNSVFTIAHEFGHSMHTYLTTHNQPYIYGDYEIFVAEVASTVNETLLLLHLLEKETDPEKHKHLICYYLDQFRSTVFRQTMFAEFEKITHEYAENGGALSCEYFCDTYYQLNKKYFGDNMVVDDLIKYEWARIPHFYRSFYVYKYATSFCAATSIAGRIFEEYKNGTGTENVDAYKKFLSSGNSTDPISLLKIAGLDMNDPKTFDNAFKIFSDMLDDLEKLF